MAAKKDEGLAVFLSIPKTNIKTAVITLEGTSPLVTNPFSKKQMEQIKAKQNTPQNEQPKKKVYEQRFPWEDFSNALYWITPKPEIKSEEDWLKALAGGPRFGFHVGGIKESALAAAMRLKQLPNLVSGRIYFNVTNVVNDSLYGTPVVEILTQDPPFMREDCLSTFNSGADMRYRPVFENWKMELHIQYLADYINLETIAYWFTLGGMGIGLGEYRAEKGGTWGSYKVA